VFQAISTNICSLKLGRYGANGVKGQKSIFGIADPDLPMHYTTFLWCRDDN